MPKTPKHKWQFAPRFRRNAFGWRSQPATKRVKEAVSEIKKVARKDPMLSAEGAILFLEKVSPALEQVDSSSGAIGTAVNNAIKAFVPIIAEAPADPKTRDQWLERLWAAHEADAMPYIERLGDYWGELCASKEVASEWADLTIDVVRQVWRPGRKMFEFFHGTSACLSALFAAERYEELIELVAMNDRTIWEYEKWRVRALAALERPQEAIQLAERRLIDDDPIPGTVLVDFLPAASTCEEILIDAGQTDEAYERFAFIANEKTTNLATFRAIAKKYPHKDAEQILADLIRRSVPEDQGKWFATAKSLKLYNLAVDLISRAPCDPKTLNRAARDHVESNPEFALEVALASLRWLAEGFGYEPSNLDVIDAFDYARTAATTLGRESETANRVRDAIEGKDSSAFVKESLGLRLNRR